MPVGFYNSYSSSDSQKFKIAQGTQFLGRQDTPFFHNLKAISPDTSLPGVATAGIKWAFTIIPKEASKNAQLEGGEWVKSEYWNATQHGNHFQIFEKAYSVSGSALKDSLEGIDKQRTLAQIALRKDINKALITNLNAVQRTATVPGELGGLYSFFKSVNEIDAKNKPLTYDLIEDALSITSAEGVELDTCYGNGKQLRVLNKLMQENKRHVKNFCIIIKIFNCERFFLIIKKIASPVNFGDTSFRRKNLIDDYKVLLQGLKQLRLEWNTQNDSQNIFYQYVVNSNLVKKSNCDIEEQKKRGRTYTNALVKIGLVDENRNLTEIGDTFLENALIQDELEQLFNLNNDNILFLRQLLKLKISDKQNNFIYIFRIALNFLLKFSNVEQDKFCKILLALEPNTKTEQISTLLDDYKQVENGDILFTDYINNILQDEIYPKFENTPIKKNTFENIFRNRKSSQQIATYRQFYEICVNFFQNKTKDNLIKLKQISSESAIKKAFGFGNIVFKFTKENNTNFLQDFLSELQNLIFLSQNLNEFNKKFYFIYKVSKYNDLIKEYSDMLIRTFRLCGFISFNNALVNLTQKELILKIFSNIKLNGNEIDDTDFLQNVSISKILILDSKQIKNVISDIRLKYNIPKNIEIKNFFKNRFDNEFESKIENRYTDDKICEILSKFGNIVEHKNIQAMITDNASVPTIFEYILAIAWHRISNKAFNLKDSMNLSLDGDGLPLSHAPGGDGDIIAKYNEFDIMLEATLMDKNSQKRAELEPIIRHSSNLTIVNNMKNRQTFTLFVADELDINVVNIFRATSYIELESSKNRNNFTKGIKIYSLDIKKIMYLLQTKKPHKELIETIFKDFQYNNPKLINARWLDDIWSNVKNL